MDIINYTDLRNGLKDAMEKVCNSHIPLAVTRKGGEPVIMMSLADYNAEQETIYLLKSKKNANRLLNSISKVEQGTYIPKELIEE